MHTNRVNTHESLVLARHYARDLLHNGRVIKYNLFSLNLPSCEHSTLDTLSLALCSIKAEAQFIRTCYTQY